jgi:hypothetical protein
MNHLALQKVHAVAGALEKLSLKLEQVTLADIAEVCPPRHQAISDRLRAGIDVLEAAVAAMGLLRGPNGGPFGE